MLMDFNVNIVGRVFLNTEFRDIQVFCFFLFRKSQKLQWIHHLFWSYKLLRESD